MQVVLKIWKNFRKVQERNWDKIVRIRKRKIENFLEKVRELIWEIETRFIVIFQRIFGGDYREIK